MACYPFLRAVLRQVSQSVISNKLVFQLRVLPLDDANSRGGRVLAFTESVSIVQFVICLLFSLNAIKKNTHNKGLHL